jgi:hypothetical protein
MYEACGADAKAASLSAQGTSEVRGNGQSGFSDSGTIAAHIEQFKRSGGLCDIGEHSTEEGIVLVLTHSSASADYEVAEG